VDVTLDVGDVRVCGFLAGPPASGGVERTRGLVLAHGYADGSDGGQSETFRELAAALAIATGWTVFTVDLRGTGQSSGRFSLTGWLADLRAAVSWLSSRETVSDVWIAGFSVAGALAICAASDDESIRGVAVFGAPAELERPPSELASQPLQAISKLPPRPVLVVHGDEDEVVPVADARALADAAGVEVELRILAGAGHPLRHDPRATAVLEGWLDRQDA
jgi:uncharacterized protein